MGYKKTPSYTFKLKTDTGIDVIPQGSIIVVNDYDGEAKTFVLNDITGLLPSSTVADAYTSGKITLTVPAAIVDAVNAASNNYVTKTTAYTALSGDYIYADTSGGAFTITLPITPSAQDRVTILDVASNFELANLTVARNGETIMGLAEDILLDVANKEYRFIYTGTDWRVMQ